MAVAAYRPYATVGGRAAAAVAADFGVVNAVQVCVAAVAVVGLVVEARLALAASADEALLAPFVLLGR